MRHERVGRIWIGGAQEIERAFGEYHSKAPRHAGRVLLKEKNMGVGMPLSP